MKRSTTLKVIFRRGLVVGHLLSTEDQTLLDRGNALLLLDLFFDLGDLVVALDVELDFFPREGSDSGWT